MGAMQKAELQQLVQKTVHGMPEHLREILLLSYFHQFPYKQISDILEIPLGNREIAITRGCSSFCRPMEIREPPSDRAVVMSVKGGHRVVAASCRQDARQFCGCRLILLSVRSHRMMT